jgi:hypothetical protein
MTTQMFDKIKYEGTEYNLASTPLEGYFAESGKERPKFTGFRTDCFRGYVARWEVEDGKLYLSGMDMKSQTDATFASLFPPGEKVFASWVSGELQCPYGALKNYRHEGFASEYEHTKKFTVEKGVVVSTEG